MKRTRTATGGADQRCRLTALFVCNGCTYRTVIMQIEVELACSLMHVSLVQFAVLVSCEVSVV